MKKTQNMADSRTDFDRYEHPKMSQKVKPTCFYRNNWP